MNKKSDSFAARGFGDSASWIDFVNSELFDGFGNFTDMFEDPTWIISFLHFWKYRRPIQDAPLKELRTLRAQLRKLIEFAVANDHLHIDQVQVLNDWLKLPVFPLLEEDQNGLHLTLVPVQSGWPVIVADIATSFAQTLVGQAHNRLKICSNPDCRWIFVDGTKGNVRRWCSSATCGNRERVRRARAGQK